MDCQSEAAKEMGWETVVQLSFEQAFELHHRVVYRYAYALTRERGLAEDVVQEVFIRLYQNLDTAQRDGLLRAWLLRVTANVARNLLRGLNRAQTRDETFVVGLIQTTATALPDEALVREAEIAETRRALDKLKEPLRSCLLLKHEGLSYREIATALDLKESNVGSLLARARQGFIRVYGKIGKS